MAELYMAAIAAGSTGEDYDSALSSFSLEYPKKKPSASSRQSPRRRYYCKYCKKSWPLSHFRNSQQFGAHCSNCSRKPRAAGALLDDSPSSPVSDMSPEDEAALDGSPLAMEVPSPDLSDDEDGACEMLCTLKVMPPRQPQQQHQQQPQQQQQQQAGSVSSLYDQSASPVPSVAQQQSQQQQQPQQPQPPQCVPATPSLSSSPALSASQGGAGPEQHQAAHAAAMAAVTGDPYVIEEAWRSLCLKLDELRAIATTSTRAMQQQPSAAFDAAVCEFLRREQAARSSLRALVSQASVLVSVRAASAAQLPPASALLPMPFSLPAPSNVVVPPSPLQQTSALLPQLHQPPASAAAVAQFATPLPPFILPQPQQQQQQQQQPQQMMLPLPSAAGLAPSPVKFPKPVPALRR